MTINSTTEAAFSSLPAAPLSTLLWGQDPQHPADLSDCGEVSPSDDVFWGWHRNWLVTILSCGQQRSIASTKELRFLKFASLLANKTIRNLQSLQRQILLANNDTSLFAGLQGQLVVICMFANAELVCKQREFAICKFANCGLPVCKQQHVRNLQVPCKQAPLCNNDSSQFASLQTALSSLQTTRLRNLQVCNCVQIGFKNPSIFAVSQQRERILGTSWGLEGSTPQGLSSGVHLGGKILTGVLW